MFRISALHLSWLIMASNAVPLMVVGKKLEPSRTIKDEPPAEPSFKVKFSNVYYSVAAVQSFVLTVSDENCCHGTRKQD